MGQVHSVICWGHARQSPKQGKEQKMSSGSTAQVHAPMNGRKSPPQKAKSSPFLWLPDEIQSIIIADVIESARRPRAKQLKKGTPEIAKQDVGNILCVSSHFRNVAIPILYREIEYYDGEVSKSLLEVLRFSGHPEYARYVQRLVLFSGFYDLVGAMEIVRAVRLAMRGRPFRGHMLQYLQIFSLTDSAHAVAEICRLLHPKDLSWRVHQEYVPPGEAVPPMYPVFAVNDPSKDAWLSGLVSLELGHDGLQETSARCIAQLPNLSALHILRWPQAHFEPRSYFYRKDIEGLLIAGGPQAKLSVVISGVSIESRQKVHQNFGVCLYAMTTAPASVTTENSGAQKGLWHGCRVLKNGQLVTSCLSCPRCCVLASKEEYSRQIAFNQFTCPVIARLCVPEPARDSIVESPSGTPFGYGLCSKHDEEIFGDSAPKDVITCLRRRALQCLRWALSDESWLPDVLEQKLELFELPFSSDNWARQTMRRLNETKEGQTRSELQEEIAIAIDRAQDTIDRAQKEMLDSVDETVSEARKVVARISEATDVAVMKALDDVLSALEKAPDQAHEWEALLAWSRTPRHAAIRK